MTARAVRTLLIAAACLGLFAAVALAAIAPPGVYNGRTKQKRTVSVQVGADAKVVRLDIRWRAKCEKKGKFWTGGTTFNDLDGTTDAFSDGGPYTATAGGGYTGIINAKVSGKFTTPEKANGKFKVKVRVEKNGKKVDVCRRSTKWHVSS